MEQEFELIAKTFMGLEPVLAQELTQLGANNVQTGRRMVSFTGDKEMLYRANFQLHTAIRILKPIAHFKARSAEDMYDEVKKIDWSQYIEKGKTFSVDSVVYSEEFRNSRFVTYKVKDAIVDQFREKTGTRPNISVSNPDIRLNIHIAEDDATLISSILCVVRGRFSLRQPSLPVISAREYSGKSLHLKSGRTLIRSFLTAYIMMIPRRKSSHTISTAMMLT